MPTFSGLLAAGDVPSSPFADISHPPYPPHHPALTLSVLPCRHHIFFSGTIWRQRTCPLCIWWRLRAPHHCRSPRRRFSGAHCTAGSPAGSSLAPCRHDGCAAPLTGQRSSYRPPGTAITGEGQRYKAAKGGDARAHCSRGDGSGGAYASAPGGGQDDNPRYVGVLVYIKVRSIRSHQPGCWSWKQ
jgi:hypothetical protein